MLKFGKQSFLKQKWKWFLKSSSLFVRIIVSASAFPYMPVDRQGKAEERRAHPQLLRHAEQWITLLPHYLISPNLACLA